MATVLFKIKFAFSEMGDNGKLQKHKLDVMAQSENYTDAEKLAYRLIDYYEMNKHETCVYEIVKTKANAHDFIYTNAITHESGELILGLVENFFESELGEIYVVNATILGNEEEKSKDFKVQYYVPALDAISAINTVKNKLARNSYGAEDYRITGTKVDGTTQLYFLPQIQEALLNSMETK